MFINEIWAKVKFVRRWATFGDERERDSELKGCRGDNVNRSRKKQIVKAKWRPGTLLVVESVVPGEDADADAAHLL